MTSHTLLTKAYKDFAKILRQYSRSKIPGKESVEDIVAETFCKAWLYIKKGGDVRMMKGFLYHILRHHIVDEYRKKKTVSLDTLMDGGFEMTSDTFDDEIDKMEARRAFELMHTLPPKYSKILHLRFAKNLSVHEISILTMQSKNTVIVQIQRGLKKLRAMMR